MVFQDLGRLAAWLKLFMDLMELDHCHARLQEYCFWYRFELKP